MPLYIISGLSMKKSNALLLPPAHSSLWPFTLQLHHRSMRDNIRDGVRASATHLLFPLSESYIEPGVVPYVVIGHVVHDLYVKHTLAVQERHETSDLLHHPGAPSSLL